MYSSYVLQLNYINCKEYLKSSKNNSPLLKIFIYYSLLTFATFSLLDLKLSLAQLSHTGCIRLQCPHLQKKAFAKHLVILYLPTQFYSKVNNLFSGQRGVMSLSRRVKFNYFKETLFLHLIISFNLSIQFSSYCVSVFHVVLDNLQAQQEH